MLPHDDDIIKVKEKIGDHLHKVIQSWLQKKIPTNITKKVLS